MPSVVYNPRFAQYLQRSLELRSGGQPLQVLDDIIPTLDMMEGDLPELARYRDEDWASGNGTNASTAVLSAQVLLTVDPGGANNHMAAVESCEVLSTIAETVTVGLVGLANAGAAVVTDTRSAPGLGIGNLKNSQFRVSSLQGGFRTTSVQWQFPCVAGVKYDVPIKGVILRAGWCLLAQSSGTAVGNFFARFTWRERALIPGDLEGR